MLPTCRYLQVLLGITIGEHKNPLANKTLQGSACLFHTMPGQPTSPMARSKSQGGNLQGSLSEVEQQKQTAMSFKAGHSKCLEKGGKICSGYRWLI